jgi:hypothetical protein
LRLYYPWLRHFTCDKYCHKVIAIPGLSMLSFYVLALNGLQSLADKFLCL